MFIFDSHRANFKESQSFGGPLREKETWMRSHLAAIHCLDHVASFSSCKEIHDFFSITLKSFKSNILRYRAVAKFRYTPLLVLKTLLNLSKWLNQTSATLWSSHSSIGYVYCTGNFIKYINDWKYDPTTATWVNVQYELFHMIQKIDTDLQIMMT